MVYRAQKGEYLFDVAAKLYGDVTLGVTRILELNTGINIDDDLFGVSIKYTDEKRRKPVFNRAEKKKTEYFYAYDLQSVYDMSLQIFGNLTGLKNVLQVHENLDEKIPISTAFERQESKDPMVKYYLNNGIIVQTFYVSVEVQNFIELEDGSGLFELEDGSGLIEKEI